jgi:Flp pilus assembly protein TadD
MLRDSGRAGDAVEPLRRCLELDSSYPEAHLLLGNALSDLDQHEAAIEAFQQAVRAKPSDVDALNNLGIALMKVGRNDEAAQHLLQVVQSNPGNVQALVNLGGALYKLERYEEALTHLQKACSIDPRNCDALNVLGSTYFALQRYEEAANVLGELLKIDPQRVNAYRERGVALREMGRLDEAVALCKRAVELEPTRYEALKSLAVAYLYQGKIDASAETFDRALVGRPDHAEGRTERAMTYLMAGDFSRGWADYEWRVHVKSFIPRTLTQPSWNGEDLTGKTILVYAEQGLGDSLQFVRYLRLVQERGARVLFECPKSLHPLLASCRGIDELIASGEPLPDFDVQSPLLSLPHRLGLPEPKDSPAPPYLSADPALIDHWKSELAGLDGFRVGINWQGSPIHKSDRFRSIPFSQFLPLAKVPGVRLISLQKGFGREQLYASAECESVLDLSSRLEEKAGAFMDTAAALHSLDLVITSDTALAHLAGSIGRPVWVVLSAIPDWRWLQHQERTPWYPSMRLFRQKALGDWSTVFAHIASNLQSLIETKTTESGGGEMPIESLMASSADVAGS